MSDPFLIPVPAPRTEADSETLPHPDAWQRQHLSALAFGMFSLVRALINFIPAVAALGFSGNAEYIPLAAVALVALHFISVTLEWLTTTYRINADSITLRSGIFSRNERHVGFDRIQDISIEQNFLARALGVAKLGIETGAGGGGDDFALNPISLAKAESLRETLRAHRQSRSEAPAPSPTSDSSEAAPISSAAEAPSTTLFTLAPRQLLLSGIFTPSLAIIAFVFALLGFTDRFQPFGYDFTRWSTWEKLADKIGLAEWLDVQLHSSVTQLLAIVTILSLIIAFLGIFTGIVRAIFRDWDYRLTREPRALRRTRGLTTRTDVAITIRRIQSATIATGLIRQKFGWHELRLRSLATDIGGRNDGGDHQALPFAQMDDVNKVLDEIPLRPDWDALTWHQSHPILMLSSILFGLFLIAVGSTIWLLVSPFGSLAVISGLLSITIGSYAARRHFYAADGQHILIRSGLISPTTTIIPFASIQSADIRDNFVYRRFGLATLALGVPGISSFADDQAPAIPLGEAILLRDQFTIRNPNL